MLRHCDFRFLFRASQIDYVYLAFDRHEIYHKLLISFGMKITRRIQLPPIFESVTAVFICGRRFSSFFFIRFIPFFFRSQFEQQMQKKKNRTQNDGFA